MTTILREKPYDQAIQRLCGSFQCSEMKKYFFDRKDDNMKNLATICQKYLDVNGIKYSAFANFIGTDARKVSRWFGGDVELSKEEREKALKFLNGDFLVPFDEIVTLK